MPREYAHHPGVVYLLQCEDIFKIGYSGRLNRRLAFLKNDSDGTLRRLGRDPSKLVLLHTIKTDDMYTAEQLLHAHFHHAQIPASSNYYEWFTLQPQDIEWICSLETL